MTFWNLCLARERLCHSVRSEDIRGTQWDRALDGVCSAFLWLSSNFGAFPFREYFCHRVWSSLCCSAWARSERYIATRLHDLMSSAFLKERTYITCQSTAMTGEAKRAHEHKMHKREGFSIIFSICLRTYPNKATKCIDWLTLQVEGRPRWEGAVLLPS